MSIIEKYDLQWFDLKNYQQKMTLNDWQEAISIRRSAHVFLCGNCFNKQDLHRFDAIFWPLMFKSVQDSENDSIPRPEEDPIFCGHSSSVTQVTPSLIARYWKCIETGSGDCSNKELLERLCYFIRPDEFDEYDLSNSVSLEKYDSISESDLFEFFSTSGLSREITTDEVPVLVNLHSSDEMILLHFKRWLKAERERHKLFARSRVIGEIDLQRWKQKRLLAYADVRLWCLRNGAQPTQLEFADIIFTGFNYSQPEKKIKEIHKEFLNIFGSDYTGGPISTLIDHQLSMF